MGSPMKEHIFADRVANIAVTGTLVRLDLAVADELPRNQGDTPVFAVTHRVLMPLDAFMSFVQMQEGIVAQLVKDGIIRKQEPQNTASPVEN